RWRRRHLKRMPVARGLWILGSSPRTTAGKRRVEAASRLFLRDQLGILGEGVVDLFLGDPLGRVARLVEVLLLGAVAHHAGVGVLGVFLGHHSLLRIDAKAIRRQR